MAMRTGNFSRLIAPGYRKVFFEYLKKRETEYDKVLNIDTSERAYEDEFKMVGVGALAAKTEGNSITYDDPIQGGTKRYTHTTLGLGYRITEEMYEDDLYNATGKKMASSLARSVTNRCEVDGWSVFNNAFSTSYIGFTASESLCSTSHAMIDGNTQSNRPSTDTDLSVSSLQAACESFESLKDERNFPIMLKPRLVIVDPSFKWAAREILDSQLRPYTSDNEINSLKNEDLSYMVSHYLTDSDSWFLISAVDEHDMKFFWRRRPKFENSDDFGTGDALFKVTKRTSYGYSDWRGVYGSQGG